MASLVEINGLIGRTQDFSVIKQNEDNKAFVDHSNIQVELDKKEDQNANTVKEADESQKQENHADAKEKGNGSYEGDGGRRRPSRIPPEGRVIKKGQTHFDLSI